MSEVVSLQKRVVNQDDFQNVVDTRFTTFTSDFTTTPNQEYISNEVKEFFLNYSRLYYDIPILGLNNSHEFLIKKSNELLGFVVDIDNIGKLVEENQTLRNQLVEANLTIAELSRQ